jgi:hypothetical protein
MELPTYRQARPKLIKTDVMSHPRLTISNQVAIGRGRVSEGPGNNDLQSGFHRVAVHGGLMEVAGEPIHPEPGNSGWPHSEAGELKNRSALGFD